MSNWMETFKSIAPALEAGLSMTGPVGMAAAAGLSAILGTDKSPEAVKLALANATPEQMAAIKKLDDDFKIQWEQLGVNLLKTDAEDRSSARNREIQVKDNTPKILAYFTVALFAAVLIGLGIGYVHPGDALRDAFMLLLGGLISETKSIYSYYFGSSDGSKAKDQMLYNSTPIGKGGE